MAIKDNHHHTPSRSIMQDFDHMVVELRSSLEELEASVQSRTHDLEIAAEVSKQVSEVLDLEELLPRFVELTRSAFNLYYAQIYLVDDAHEMLVLRAGTGDAGHMMRAAGHHIALDTPRSLVARTARERQPFITNDTASSPDHLPNQYLPDTCAEMTVPLVVGDELIGVLDLQARELGRFSEEDRRLLTTLAGQVAVAVQNARAFEVVQAAQSDSDRRARELEAVAEVSVLSSTLLDVDEMLQSVADLAQERFGLYHAQIYLLEDDGQYLSLAAGSAEAGRVMRQRGHAIRIDHPHSIVARCARVRSGIIVNDVGDAPDFLPNPLLPETRSEMAVPLLVGADLIGVLDVQSREFDRFDQDDIRIKTTLAQQVAVSVQNARAYAAVETARAETQRLYDMSVDMIGSASLSQATFLSLNPAWERTLGWTADELTAQPFLAFVHPDDQQDTIEKTQQAIQTGQVAFGFENRYRTKAGDYRWLQWSASAPPGSDEIFFIARDITEEKAAREQIQVYADIVRNMGIGLYVYHLEDINDDRTLRLTATNPAASAFTGASMDELVGNTLDENFPGLREQGLPQAYAEVVRTGRSFETENVYGDDRVVTAAFGVKAFPLPNQSVGVTFENITERKQQEAALRASEERFRTLIENAPETVVLVDMATARFVEASRSATELFGYSYDEMMQLGPTDVGADEQAGGLSSEAFTYARIQDVLDTGYSQFEWNIVTKAGAARTVEVRLIQLPDTDPPLIRATVVDITERKEAELALERSEQRFRNIAQTMPGVVFQFTVRNGVWTVPYMSDQIYDITGVTAAEMMADLSVFIERVHPDDLEYYTNSIVEVLQTVSPWRYEGRLIHRETGEVRWWQGMSDPVQSPDGEIVFNGVLFDITDRKRTEAEVQQRAAEMATVAEVSTATTTILDVNELLWSVSDLTKERFNLYHAHIYLLNDTGDTLVLTAGAGEAGRQMVAEHRIIPFDHPNSLVARAAQTRDGVIVNDVTADENFLPHPALPNTKAELAAPLIVGNRLVGVLDVQADVTDRFTDEDVRIYNTLAAQIAVAVQNARSFEQSERRAQELAIVADVSVEASRNLDPVALVREVAERTYVGFNLYHLHVYLTDEAGDNLRLVAGTGQVPCQLVDHNHALSLNDPDHIVSRAARDRRGVIENRVADNPDFDVDPNLPLIQAQIAIPLVAGGELVGVLEAHSEIANRFGDEDIQIYNTLAAQVAVAVQNARAYEETQRSQQFLQRVLDSTPDLIYVKDDQYRYAMVNHAFADMFAMTPEEIVGKDDLDMGFTHEMVFGDPAKDIHGYRNDDIAILHRGETLHNPFNPAIDAHGRERILDTYKMPLTDSSGRPYAVLAFSRDITQEHEQQQRLLQQATILENTDYAISLADMAGNVVYANPAGIRLTGYDTLDELLTRNVADFQAGSEYERVRDEIIPYVMQHGLWRGESVFTRKDGSTVPVEQTMFLVRDSDGKPVNLGTVLTDITERKAAEERQLALNRRLELATNAGGIGIWEWNIQTNELIWDDQMYALYGTRPEDFSGAYDAWTNGLHPDDSGRSQTEIQAAVRGEKPFDTVFRVVWPDGTVRYLKANAILVKDEAGDPLRMIGVNQDITEQVEFEERQLALNRRLELAANAGGIGIWEWNIQTNELIWDDQMYTLYGTKPEDFSGAYDAWTNGLHPDDSGRSQTEIQAAVRGEKPFDTTFRVVWPDGTVRYLKANAVLVKDEAGDPLRMIGVNQDITERITSEAEIARRASELQTVADVSAATTTMLDVNDLLWAVATLTRDRFSLYHAHIYLLNEPGDTLVLTAGAGEAGRQMVAEKRTIPFDHPNSLVARAAQTREGVIANDVTANPDFLPHPALPDTKAEMAVPMLVGDQLIGVLDVQANIKDRFTEEDVQVKTTLAAQIAVAIENARSFEQAQKRAAELATVAEVGRAATSLLDVTDLLQSVVDLTKERFALYHAHVYLYDADNNSMVLAAGAGEAGRKMREKAHSIPFNHPHSLVAACARRREGVVANDVTQAVDFLPNPLLPETRSEIAVPLVVGNELIGVLDVQSERPNRFTDEDVRIKTTLAGQIAVAVQNARVFAAIEEARADVQRLYDLSVDMIGSASLTTATLTSVNPAWTKTLGWTEEELTTRPFFEFVHPDDLERTQTEVQRELELGHISFGFENRYRTKDGDYRWLSWAASAPVGGDMVYFVARDVTEEKEFAIEREQLLQRAQEQAERERQTAERLREVDRLKSQFLANMSHELRTPLNSIIGYAEILLDGDDGELAEDAVEDVETIHASGQHLLAIINDILDLAKIESGQMQLNIESVDLADFARKIVHAGQILVKDKAVALEMVVEEQLQVKADPVRLRQIIWNIVSNAVKFTEEGSVTVTLGRWRDDLAYVQVVDTGIGISKDHQEEVFHQFRQVDESTTRRAGGTGLGLTITRYLVNMHGGEIWVESELGEGSTFTFTMPLDA